MIVDVRTGLVHQAGCEWFCGVHDPEQYVCGCLTPRKKRGQDVCAECGGGLPTGPTEQEVRQP